jgi:predicted nucleotidyltransferase
MDQNLKKIASEQDDFKRKMMFMGWLSGKMKEKGIDFILVGGSAAEVYSFGKYQSADIDLVSSGSIGLRETLSELGFKQTGKNWISEELRLLIEIPDSVLVGDQNKVRAIEIGNGMTVKVIGIEDLILDRLVSCKFWKFKNDCEIAEYLLFKYRDDLDMEYLTETAMTEKVIDKLQELLNENGEENTIRPR